MYEAFFCLDDSPFVLTPDPRFLLRSKSHHEILSSILYGITSQKGLMALIGDVGTGKTTLCRALLRELPADVQSALVLNPHLSDVELLGTILDDLGIERRGATKGELMTTLNQHLLAAGEEGKTVVVVLDEAQQMSVEALEQIRILSTLETATRKLLQIVLVGQPELEEKLRRRDLRQLDQRIGIRGYLRPLSRKDTARYVEHRLRVAGLPGALPFTPAALGRVYRWSGGVPRVINLLCDRALMAAYSARAHEVTPALVAMAARNLEGRRRAQRLRTLAPAWPALRRLVVAAGLAGVVVLAGVLATSWLPGPPLPAAMLPARRAGARAARTAHAALGRRRRSRPRGVGGLARWAERHARRGHGGGALSAHRDILLRLRPVRPARGRVARARDRGGAGWATAVSPAPPRPGDRHPRGGERRGAARPRRPAGAGLARFGLGGLAEH
jgi:general secretion pathway protein A